MSKRLKNPWLFPALLALLLPGVCAAGAERDIRFRRLTPSDGLSQGTVHAILQDRQGFLWFGTDDGLNRYDGYSFRTYRSAVDEAGTLGSNVIFCLAEDGRGRLWAGAWEGGLNCFDPATERFRVFRARPGAAGTLSDDRLNAIVPDPSGKMWVATEGGLNLFDPDTGNCTRFRRRPGASGSLADDWVNALHLGADGVLWVGTRRGLCRFGPDRRSFDPIPFPAGPNAAPFSDHVTALEEDSSRRLWVGTSGGLFYLDRASTALVPFLAGDDGRPLIGGAVWALFEDRDGLLWIGTSSGLYRLDRRNGRLDHCVHDPRDPSSLGDNFVLALAQDRSGVLWVGSRGRGLSSYKPGRLKFGSVWSGSGGPLAADVYSILPEPDGSVWLGTRGGLARGSLSGGGEGAATGGPYLAERFAEAFADSRHLWEKRLVQSLLRDRRGGYWVAVRDAGLFHLPAGGGTPRMYRNLPGDIDAFRSNQILTLFEDRSGAIWMCRDGSGLVRLNPADGSVVTYRRRPADPASLANDYVMMVAEDADGTLWAATWGGGVSRLNRATGKFDCLRHRPGDPRSLSHDIATTVYRDSRNTLWVGTYGGGLNRYDRVTGGFDRFTVKDGLANNIVCGILEDDQGDLWISTYGGISRFQTAIGRFASYTEADGLPANEFNIRSCARMDDGRLLFGGVRGACVFRPEAFSPNPTVPPLVFTGYRRFGPGGIPEERHWVGKEELDLSYRDSVTIGFAALDFTNPSKNRYAYQLEGGYPGWVQLGSRHEITFASLAPGVYTLRVKGSNDDGVWNERSIALTIRVEPPFWQTAWFRLAGLALLVGLLAAGYVVRVRALKVRERDLRRLVDERTDQLARSNAELQEMDRRKTEFLNIASHELRTPLTSVLGFARLIRKKAGGVFALPAVQADPRAVRAAGQVGEYLDVVIDEGERLTGLINDLLDISKMEEGKTEWHMAPLDPGDMVGHAAAAVAGLLEQRQLTLRQEVQLPLPVVEGDRERLMQVVINLLSNAVKFTPEGGTVRVVARGVRIPEPDGGVPAAPAAAPAAERDLGAPSPALGPGEYLQVSVFDTGVGIAPENLERIFEKFQQVNGGQGQGVKGTGLGLAICRQIVEHHGGLVWAASEPGRGSAFSFCLPSAGENPGGVSRPEGPPA